MTPKGEKFACESCIRGHRVAQCQHTDRPLLRVNRKGRPVSQCTHCRSLRNSRSVHTKCKCASISHQAMLKQLGRERCTCSEGGVCKCAYKSDQMVRSDVLSLTSRGHSSTPSTTLSPPESEHKAREIAPMLLQSDYTESLALSHHSAETVNPVSAPGLTSLDGWPNVDMLNAWDTPLEDSLPDSLLYGTPDLMGTWDSVPSIRMNQQAQMTIPTFEDPLSTMNPLGLSELFSEPDAVQIPKSDNWNPLHFRATSYHDPEQGLNQP